MLVLSSFCNKCGKNSDKIFKEEEPIETLKIFGFIGNVNESNIYFLRWKKYTEYENPIIS